MINILNKNDNNGDLSAADFRGMRFWSPEWVLKQFQLLAQLGVSTIRISDEMFFLNKKYYKPILSNLANFDLGLNMWAYSRVDSVREDALELFKSAGVNWLALGIEAGNQGVRQEVSKGTFKEINIRDVCKSVRDNDINIISNYIFGFPEDNHQTMQETLDLALELNTEMANMYPCQALPGSPMFLKAKRKGQDLPQTYAEFAFLSFETKPLATKYVSAAEVLRFRDEAWQTYFTNSNYLELVESKFGGTERQNIEVMSRIRLKRKLLGD